MDTAKLNIRENARALRRREIARIGGSLFRAISESMRIDHEMRLRRSAGIVPRLPSVNGTPA